MKDKHIIKDILKLHPELKNNEKTLKKTVKFLRGIQPEVTIDQEFRSNLGEKLFTLATLKSSSAESFMKKPGLVHIFGGVSASLFAFFGLFYVFGESLFYASETPVVSEYEAQISDIDVIQETKLEIQSINQVSQPIEEPNAAKENTIKTKIVIPNDASQENKSDAMMIEPRAGTSEIQQSLKTNDTSVSPEEQNVDIADAAGGTPAGDESGAMVGGEPDMMEPTMQDASFSADLYQDEDMSESEAEVIDEFTLRCDVFGGEVSLGDEERVCNIGDIVCTETDFLKGVCELGQ